MTSNNRKPSFRVVRVTPELAEEWLGKNTHNRNIRQSTVDAYARDMAAGRWLLTGDAIEFGPDGVLYNGQHRCLAIVKSRQTVEMLVAEGIAADAQRVRDAGPRRSPSDMLKLEGHANYSTLAAAVRFAMTYPTGVEPRNQSKTPTHSEIGEFLTKNEDLADAVAASRYYRKTIDIPPSITAVAWWQLVRLDADACENFFNSIANNATTGDGDPRNTLIKRLNSARRSNERLPQIAQLSMLFRVWNAWLQGKSLHSLPVYSTKDGGVVAVPKPIAPN